MQRSTATSLFALLSGLSASCGNSTGNAPADASVDARSDLGVAPVDAGSVTDVVDASVAVDAVDVTAVTDVPTATDSPDAADVSAGNPITAPDRTWTWVDVPGAVCDDGSPTGMGVNLVAGATGLLVYLPGGGLCWDYQTCFVLNTSTHGPYGRAQFDSVSSQFGQGIIDRDLAGSPFANFNLVYVPYCTGDLHAGTRATSYTGGGTTRTHQHVGRNNLRAILLRLASGLPTPANLVLAGSGAGGFGAVFNHELARSIFPTGTLSVVDDSGPLLRGDAIPAAQRSAWYASWGLDWLDAGCAGCRTDLSALYGSLATRFPNDRTALLGSLQDAVNRTAFMQTPADYEAAFRALATSLSTQGNRRVFAVSGAGTVLLRRPAMVSATDATSLLPWLAAMVTGASGWTSHGP